MSISDSLRREEDEVRGMFAENVRLSLADVGATATFNVTWVDGVRPTRSVKVWETAAGTISPSAVEVFVSGGGVEASGRLETRQVRGSDGFYHHEPVGGSRVSILDVVARAMTRDPYRRGFARDVPEADLEEWTRRQLRATFGDLPQLRSAAEEQAITAMMDLVEAHGWFVSSVDLGSHPYAELESYAPNGMDAVAEIELDLLDDGGMLGFDRGLVEYLESYDPDTECLVHFQPSVMPAGRPSIRSVLEDCEWVQDSLLEMHDSLCVTVDEVVRMAQPAKERGQEVER